MEVEQGDKKAPLVDHCWDRMVEQGIGPEVAYSREQLEDWFGMLEEDSPIRFSMAVSRIRDRMRALGYYLEGGANGATYTVLHPRENARVMKTEEYRAQQAFRRASVLGSCTPLDDLTDDEVRAHERQTYRSQLLRAVTHARTRELGEWSKRRARPKRIGNEE